ncbi:unnamed protein product, partial [Ectocarpus sp. 12 AP-2014]
PHAGLRPAGRGERTRKRRKAFEARGQIGVSTRGGELAQATPPGCLLDEGHLFVGPTPLSVGTGGGAVPSKRMSSDDNSCGSEDG